MKMFNDGSWELDLGGISFREMAILAKMLTELADKGELYKQKYDLDTLKARFNSHTGEVDLYDDEGNTTEES